MRNGAHLEQRLLLLGQLLPLRGRRAIPTIHEPARRPPLRVPLLRIRAVFARQDTAAKRRPDREAKVGVELK